MSNLVLCVFLGIWACFGFQIYAFSFPCDMSMVENKKIMWYVCDMSMEQKQQLDAPLILEGWKKSNTLLRMLLVLLLKAVLRWHWELPVSALRQWSRNGWPCLTASMVLVGCFGALLRTDKRGFVKVVMHGLVEHGSESCADLMLGCCSYDVHALTGPFGGSELRKRIFWKQGAHTYIHHCHLNLFRQR